MRWGFITKLSGILIVFLFNVFVCCLGPFTFTYNRGHGECKSPVSNIESCTEDSRLLLNLQACPDVAGTESTGRKFIFKFSLASSLLRPSSVRGVSAYVVHLATRSIPSSHLHIILNKNSFIVEELTCLATWKDGNSRYLVGLVSHHHAISNEERYRCFVYEKILPPGKNGLTARLYID